METFTTVEVLPRQTSREIVGVATLPDREILLQAFANFIDQTVADGRPTQDTRAGYASAIKPFLAYCQLHQIALAAVTPGQVKTYRTWLRDKGRAASTVSLYLTAVRRFYDATVEANLIDRNPATGIKGAVNHSAPEDKMKALSANALQSLADALPADKLVEYRDRVVVALMSLHGLRRIEVHRLDHEFLQLDSEGGILNVPGKGDKTRRAFLRSDTLRCWQEYEEAKLLAGYPIQGPFIIALDNANAGKRLSRVSLNAVVDRALNSTGLKQAGVSCHALRHTYGTLAVAGGAKIEHLRDAMGHTKIETTSGYVRAVEKRRYNPSLCIEPKMKFKKP